jgi:exopolysaccharide biosynthesis polyprenyl glycosylphosphotransferase
MNLAARVSADTAQPALAAPSPARSLEQRRLQFYLALVVADVVLLLGAFLLAGLVYRGDAFSLSTFLPAQLLLPLYLTIALYNRTYSIESLRNWKSGLLGAVTALVIAATLLSFFAFLVKINVVFSRVGFVLGAAFTVVLFTAARAGFDRLARRIFGPSPLNVLVIDANGPAISLPHSIHISAAEHALVPALDDPHALDRLARFVTNMDQVIVSCPVDERIAWAMALKGAGVHSEVLSDFMNEIGALGVVRRDEIGLATLLVATGPLGVRDRIMKRALDIGLSLVALLVVSPILLLAALAIKLEDGGPVMFRQRRIGRRNQLFSIYKLRTMSVAGSDADGNRSTRKGDARITRIGNFLRRTSIDELPQILNVLKGDMSLVGPRPHAIGSLAGDKLFWEVDQRYWHRHSLRPGLTGLAQVRGYRGATDRESDLSSRLQADLEYLAGWSILRDIRILFATLGVLVHDRAF